MKPASMTGYRPDGLIAPATKVLLGGTRTSPAARAPHGGTSDAQYARAGSFSVVTLGFLAEFVF